MTVAASSAVTQLADSEVAGSEAAHQLIDDIGVPDVVLAYLTVNHDAKAFLAAVQEVVGPNTPVLGCSTQGLMGREFFAEDGYIAGLMGIGGDTVSAAAAHVEDIAEDTLESGRHLAAQLREQTDVDPKVVILHYDSLCGVDMDVFLTGFHQVLPCTVVGGGASHLWGPLRTTYQYIDGRVLSSTAVAVALSGDFEIETAISHGCSPVGIAMTVTAAEGNQILELDGSPAVEVWKEIAGSATQTGGDQTAALALGVPVVGGGNTAGYLVRAAFGFAENGGAILQSGIAAGTDVMLHHRTIEDAVSGSQAMGAELASRLDGKTVRAVLGFECGGRTKPFLGVATCRSENDELQEAIGADAAWLGALAWGEIHPVGEKSSFNNFTYPMLVIAE